MTHLTFEDKYFEQKLPDGTVVFTRTQNVVNALLYYRKQFIDIIELTKKQTPRIMMTESFEDLMKKIRKTNDIDKKIRQAEDAIIKIDSILKRMSVNQSKDTPAKNNDNNQFEK